MRLGQPLEHESVGGVRLDREPVDRCHGAPWKTRWPWQPVPGPMMTNDPRRGVGKRVLIGAREHEPHRIVCPLRYSAAEQPVENYSRVNRVLASSLPPLAP